MVLFCFVLFWVWFLSPNKAETLRFMDDALDDEEPFFVYMNPTMPHGTDTSDVVQNTSDTSGVGPYSCVDTTANTRSHMATEDEGGAYGAAWAAECSESLYDGAVNFSEWCPSGCDMSSRNEIWASSRVVGQLQTTKRDVIASAVWLNDVSGLVWFCCVLWK